MKPLCLAKIEEHSKSGRAKYCTAIKVEPRDYASLNFPQGDFRAFFCVKAKRFAFTVEMNFYEINIRTTEELL